MNLSQTMKSDHQKAHEQKIKLALFNNINKSLSRSETSDRYRRAILESFNRYLSMDGSIDDFKKHKEKLKIMVDGTRTECHDIEKLTAER